jgi:rubredoxin
MAKPVIRKKSAAKKATTPAAAKKKPLTTPGRKAARAARPSMKKAAPVKKSAPVGKKSAVPEKKTVKKAGAKKGNAEVVRYRCRLCGYIYSPLRGEPHNGIPQGTAFEDLPDNYVCPVCGQQG